MRLPLRKKRSCVLSLTEATFRSICFATKICSYISNCQQEVGLGADFDARVLAEVETPVVKAKRLTLTARFVPLFKAAAVVAVVLSLGNVMQHSFYSDIKEVAAADTIGKQITTPSVALSGDVTITHEQQILDSLQRIDKKVELKK